MTETEKLLWSKIRSGQLKNSKFRRQEPIGKFIVDFVCYEKKLILELDGSQHFDQTSYDSKRTEWLESQDFRVLRFWDNEVFKNLEGVLMRIMEYL